MIKTLFLISGLTFFGPGAGGINLHNPIHKAEFKISHLELSVDECGYAMKIQKTSKSGLKLVLQSEKIIEVRF